MLIKTLGFSCIILLEYQTNQENKSKNFFNTQETVHKPNVLAIFSQWSIWLNKTWEQSTQMLYDYTYKTFRIFWNLKIFPESMKKSWGKIMSWNVFLEILICICEGQEEDWESQIRERFKTIFLRIYKYVLWGISR